MPTCFWILVVSSPTCLWWKRGPVGNFFGQVPQRSGQSSIGKLTCQNLRQYTVNTNLRPNGHTRAHSPGKPLPKPTFFFHEYGRRVGMVPRSSLKEGKNNQMVEKGTKTPNQPKPNTKARRPKLHHLVVFPLHWVKRVKRRLVAINGPEFSREKGRQRKLCSWKAA